jgi:cation diffusion facilitator family transporter
MSVKRNKKIKSVLIYTLILNWLVALAKIIFGYSIKSISMAADGFHSFADGGSDIIGLVGIWVATKPRDSEHPYGHKKYETFAAIFIAFILFLMCFNILRMSWQRLCLPLVPEINIYAFVLMGFTIIINVSVMLYERTQGRRLKSDILISDSLHTRADILTSCSVIIAFIAIKNGFVIFDTVGSTVIVLFIVRSAVEILRQTSRVLCDTAVVDTSTIENIVRGINGVISCHKVRTRGRPDDIHLDLHVLVRNDMHMDKAHHLSYQIEDKIKKSIPGVTDVVVHMEPLTSRD